MINNFESNKLFILNADEINGIIFAIVFILTLLTLRRNEKPSNFFDRITTEQVRGIAILMVVIGHIWVHVTQISPHIVLSGDGVAIFLILSGFGIVKSLKREPRLKQYIINRINRVMIPYWAATVIILLLDWIFLDRLYSFSHILATLSGINVYGIMHHFDYVRWYITFLLFWYVSVIIIYRTIHKTFWLYAMFGWGMIVFFIDYYVIKVGWYHFFAFPIGCFIAEKYNICEKIIHSIGKKFGVLFLILAVISVYTKYYLLDAALSNLPSIVILLINEMCGLLFALSLISFINMNQLTSRFLLLCGKYSYEIFLLHGVFLIKYNPFFNLAPLPVAFIIYFLFMLALSVIMKLSLQQIKFPQSI